MGIIGDGCGGGREFIVEDEKLFAYDDVSSENMVLLESVKDAISISKKACILTVTCRGQIIEFDLSSMSQKVIKI
jgi:hypothetical protein